MIWKGKSLCLIFFYFSKNVWQIRRRAWIERLRRVCSHSHPPKYAFLEGISLFAFPIYPRTARRRIKSKSNDISLVCDVCIVRSLYSQLYNFPMRLFLYPNAWNGKTDKSQDVFAWRADNLTMRILSKLDIWFSRVSILWTEKRVIQFSYGNIVIDNGSVCTLCEIKML